MKRQRTSAARRREASSREVAGKSGVGTGSGGGHGRCTYSSSEAAPARQDARSHHPKRSRRTMTESAKSTALRPTPLPEPVETAYEGPPVAKRQRIVRARIPPALARDQLRVTDRLSGPILPDTAEGHYVFCIGDNLTPRCK